MIRAILAISVAATLSGCAVIFRVNGDMKCFPGALQICHTITDHTP